MIKKSMNKLNTVHTIKWGGTDNTMIPTMKKGAAFTEDGAPLSKSVVSDDPGPKPVAVISKIVGDVKVGGSKATWGQKVFNLNEVKTGPESFTALIYLDRSLVKMRANQSYIVKSRQQVKKELDTEIYAKVGEINRKAGGVSKFKIQTPTSVASVKG